MNIKFVDGIIKEIRSIRFSSKLTKQQVEVDVRTANDPFIATLTLTQSIVNKLNLKEGKNVQKILYKNFIIGIRMDNGLSYLLDTKYK